MRAADMAREQRNERHGDVHKRLTVNIGNGIIKPGSPQATSSPTSAGTIVARPDFFPDHMEPLGGPVGGPGPPVGVSVGPGSMGPLGLDGSPGQGGSPRGLAGQGNAPGFSADTDQFTRVSGPRPHQPDGRLLDDGGYQSNTHPSSISAVDFLLFSLSPGYAKLHSCAYYGSDKDVSLTHTV